MTSERPTFEELTDLVEGRLSPERAREVAAQIAASPSLAATHRWLTATIAPPDRIHFEPPGADIHDTLISLMPARRRNPLASAVRHIGDNIARLVRDVQAGPAFAGARSGDVAASRQLMFDLADELDLVVEVEVDARSCRLSGQLLGASGQRPYVVSSDDGDVDGHTDDLGEFEATVARPSFLLLTLADNDDRHVIDLTPYLDPNGDEGRSPLRGRNS